VHELTVQPISKVSKTSRQLPVAQKKRFFSATTVPYTLWWRCYTERYNKR